LTYWIFFVLLARLALAEDGTVQILVEHSFGGKEFAPRGYVAISKSLSGDQLAEYVPGEWSSNDQISLMDAAKNGQMYKIRAPMRFDTETVAGTSYVMSSTPACFMVRSQLTDNIHLAIDSSRQRVLSISAYPLSAGGDDCQMSSFEEGAVLEEFNTTVRLVDTVDGPIPETQAYLQKVEREKQERQRGEQGDNRSFLSKYWMYIVPVVIVLMLSSAMNPDAQGGGNRH